MWLKDLSIVAISAGRKIRTLRRSHSFWATTIICAKTLSELPWRARLLFAEAAYDRRRGVETSRLVKLEDLGIDPAKREHASANASGIAYMPTPAWFARAVLQDMGLRYENYTFIDLGSGMGRVVLAAAEYPFRKVVGVELSQELHEIAERNIAKVSDDLRAGAIELICRDAAEYPFPDGNCVIYLFNPFREAVMRRVLANLERTDSAARREIYIIYYNPVLGTMLDAVPFLVRTRSTREFAIYRSASLGCQLAAEAAVSVPLARQVPKDNRCAT